MKVFAKKKKNSRTTNRKRSLREKDREQQTEKKNIKRQQQCRQRIQILHAQIKSTAETKSKVDGSLIWSAPMCVYCTHYCQICISLIIHTHTHVVYIWYIVFLIFFALIFIFIALIRPSSFALWNGNGHLIFIHTHISPHFL